jgi:hypothetical protein
MRRSVSNVTRVRVDPVGLAVSARAEDRPEAADCTLLGFVVFADLVVFAFAVLVLPRVVDFLVAIGQI